MLSINSSCYQENNTNATTSTKQVIYAYDLFFFTKLLVGVLN